MTFRFNSGSLLGELADIREELALEQEHCRALNDGALALQAALREREWVSVPIRVGTMPLCLSCAAQKTSGHKPDCPIPALLGGAPPAGDALLSPREAMRPDERAAHQRGLDRMARKRGRGDAP